MISRSKENDEQEEKRNKKFIKCKWKRNEKPEEKQTINVDVLFILNKPRK